MGFVSELGGQVSPSDANLLGQATAQRSLVLEPQPTRMVPHCPPTSECPTVYIESEFHLETIVNDTAPPLRVDDCASGMALLRGQVEPEGSRTVGSWRASTESSSIDDAIQTAVCPRLVPYASSNFDLQGSREANQPICLSSSSHPQCSKVLCLRMRPTLCGMAPCRNSPTYSLASSGSG